MLMFPRFTTKLFPVILFLFSSPVLASAYTLPGKGDVVLRARALGVLPHEDASIAGVVTGNEISIENSIVPELDLSYFLTDTIALEVIAAVTPHEVGTKNSSAGPLDLGNVWLLPPTLLLQYHYKHSGAFKPYVGAGINYTVFFNDDAGSSVTNVKYENSIGPALQIGADYALDEHWMLNVDAKKLWVNSDVSFNNGAIAADVDIDPVVIGLGIGYRF